MENIYIEEQKASINQLMMNLEQFPVGKAGLEGKNALYKMSRFVKDLIEDNQILQSSSIISIIHHHQSP